ncbi:unnamed protein product [Urochloa humidicola]
MQKGEIEAAGRRRRLCFAPAPSLVHVAAGELEGEISGCMTSATCMNDGTNSPSSPPYPAPPPATAAGGLPRALHRRRRQAEPCSTLAADWGTVTHASPRQELALALALMFTDEDDQGGDGRAREDKDGVLKKKIQLKVPRVSGVTTDCHVSR